MLDSRSIFCRGHLPWEKTGINTMTMWIWELDMMKMILLSIIPTQYVTCLSIILFFNVYFMTLYFI